MRWPLLEVDGVLVHPLARAREVRGWNAPELARRLRELGRRRGVPVGTGKDGVYRWEDGRQPDEPTRRLIAELLEIPSEAIVHSWPGWLALDPLQQPTRHAWDAPGAICALSELSGTETPTMTMNRRQFAAVSGATLTTSLWAWLTADPAAAGQITNARRLGETAVTRVEERVRQLRHADDIDGGGQIMTETASSLELVIHLLKDRSYGDAHGARLHAAAADLARMHAWATFDLTGHSADAVFHAALRSAHASSDPALGSHVLAFWAIAAYNSGRPQDAEAMANTALSAARGRTTPRVEAMLYGRRARARAHQGDRSAFADLARAADLLDASPHDDADPEWVYWFDQAELLGSWASTHLDLDRPDRAEAVFVEAAALFPPSKVRTQALYLARRADAQWRQHDPERACATAHQALDIAETISSHRSAAPLRDLVTRMDSRTAGVAAVGNLRERLAAMPRDQ